MKGIEEDFEVVEAEEEEADSSGLSLAEEAPIVKLVNSLIADAVRKGASDIHIEPYEKSLRVRFRIDGAPLRDDGAALQVQARHPVAPQDHGELDIAERRVPQDGASRSRCSTAHHRPARLDAADDIRREDRDALLDKTNLNIDLEKLGFEPRSMEAAAQGHLQPLRHGAGDRPDGVGKTTTLYSALSRNQLRPRSTS